jgi:hypothetical protein
MFLKKQLLAVPICALGLSAGDQTWKDKEIAAWTEDDARQVITDSPWARKVTPELGSPESRRSDRGGRPGYGGGGGGGYPGGGGGVGFPGGGIGFPGGGRRGGGYPGGGGGNSQGSDTSSDGSSRAAQTPPTLTVRWETALPVREAELKARDTSAPVVEEGHYAIAVYGIPERMTRGDSKNLADSLKKEASLRRDGKKELKPSSVEVLPRDDGPVVLYLFPKSNEITQADRRVEFDVKIGRLKFSQPFFLEDMVFKGKLEL